METELASKILCFFKKLDDAQVPKKTVSVNLSHAVFLRLDFLTLEVGTSRLFRNVGKELPLISA
jgi:hypothetical protein